VWIVGVSIGTLEVRENLGGLFLLNLGRRLKWKSLREILNGYYYIWKQVECVRKEALSKDCQVLLYRNHCEEGHSRIINRRPLPSTILTS